MTVVYKVMLNGVAVNLYSNPNDSSASRREALEEFHRVNKKYPGRRVEVIRVSTEVIRTTSD